jgi:hypothetical protein
VATSNHSDSTFHVSRRGFLYGALATAVGLPLLNACAPAATPSSSAPAGAPPASGGAPAAGGAAKSLFPTYIPVSSGPKPDFHDPNPLYSDAFNNYPMNPARANTGTPGTGSTVNVLIPAYFPSPVLRDQNPTWQAVNSAQFRLEHEHHSGC